MAISIIRTMMIYAALLVSMRLMGKRQLGEMELSEFVVASLIADLASHPLQDVGIPMINGLVPIFTLFCCELLIAGLSLKSVRLRALLFGKPSMLILRGQICQKEMRANRFTVDELMEELRAAGITDLSRVKYAVLETTGRVSVLPYAADQPPSAREQGLKVKGPGLPVTLISDGRVIERNLARMGLGRGWLEKEIRSRGAADPSRVFLLTVDETGKVYYIPGEAKA